MPYARRAAFCRSCHSITSHNDHPTARLRELDRGMRFGNSPRRSSSQIVVRPRPAIFITSAMRMVSTRGRFVARRAFAEIGVPARAEDVARPRDKTNLFTLDG